MDEQIKQGVEHHFVTYDVAVLLFQHGFDEPCQARFFKKQFQRNCLGEWYRHNSGEISQKYLSAPLYQQVQEWFRTKYFIDINVKYICGTNEVVDTYGLIDFMINKFNMPDVKVEPEEWLTHNQILALTFKKAFQYLPQNIATIENN